MNNGPVSGRSGQLPGRKVSHADQNVPDIPMSLRAISVTGEAVTLIQSPLHGPKKICVRNFSAGQLAGAAGHRAVIHLGSLRCI